MLSTRYAALVTLFLVPAIIVEFLTGNMTFAVLADPFSLAMLFASYGSGAVLARELARHWRKSFAAILILGAVYGMFNEALGTGGFFDPHFYAVQQSGLENYGRWGGVNIIWALQITIFHAVYSIAVPIIIVDALFPLWADRPLLASGKPLAGFFGLLLLVTVVQRVILTSRQPPIDPYAFALVILLMVALTVAARVLPSSAAGSRSVPGNVILLVCALVGSFAWIVIVPRVLSLLDLPLLHLLAIVCELFLASWLLLRFVGNSLRQRLALAAGAEGPVMVHALTSGAFVPAAITLALFALAWQRSGGGIAGRPHR